MIKLKYVIVLLIGWLITIGYDHYFITKHKNAAELLASQLDTANQVILRHETELSNAKAVNDHQQNIIDELTALKEREALEAEQLEKLAQDEKALLNAQLDELKRMVNNDTDCANAPMPSNIYGLLKQH